MLSVSCSMKILTVPYPAPAAADICYSSLTLRVRSKRIASVVKTSLQKQKRR